MTTISLIEEQNLFRNSLESLINSYENCSITGTYSSIELFTKTSKSNQPESDLIIISIFDINESGKNRINIIHELFPLSRIIVFSEELDRIAFNLLTKLDVFAFFSISASPIELKTLLCNYDKYATYHQIKIDSHTRAHLRSQTARSTYNKIEFTQRELEVLNLVCQQMTNSEISESLGLSVRTIESFRRRMIIKTNSKNMIGVIIKALQLSDFVHSTAERA
ncbi:MAG: DNA-binding NarL/FixJ family response regulator [Crocinitomix sp.]|jgi:DNA-binding NarL/FixJ family response regulator